jgi:hypothetical protein
MVRALSSDGLEQPMPRGRSAMSRRTVRETSPSQKQLAKRIERKALRHMRRTQRSAGWLAPRGQSAQGPWTVCQARRQHNEPDHLKVNTSFPLPDHRNQPRDYYQIIGEDEVPLGDAMPTNLQPQTHGFERNRDSTELKNKDRYPTEILQSKAEFGV